MSKITDMACDNETCKKASECARFQAFKDGFKPFKTLNGNPNKGCGQFVQK